MKTPRAKALRLLRAESRIHYKFRPLISYMWMRVADEMVRNRSTYLRLGDAALRSMAAVEEFHSAMVRK